MVNKIKLSELVKKEVFEEHKEELATYFSKGGTWQMLLGYDDSVMNGYYQKAYDLYQEAKYEEAVSAFSYLTMLNPYNYTYWMGLGQAKEQNGQLEESLVSFTAAEAIDPEHPLPHLHLANAFEKLGLKDNAIKHLERAVKTANRQEFADLRTQAHNRLYNLRGGR